MPDMDKKRKLCKKCLLSEIDEGEVFLQIKKLIDIMPAAEKCREDEYKRRLGICKECSFLNEGTCEACGCYVELRAIKKDARCPHERRMW